MSATTETSAAPLQIALRAPVAAILPQPLDRVLTQLRDTCRHAPLGELIGGLDALCEDLFDDEAMQAAAAPILRRIDERAWLPGEHHSALLPPELLVQPPPKPDLEEIARRLRAGEAVPGAALTNGGDPTVQIRSKK